MSPLLSPPSPYKWMPYIAVLPLILVLIRAPSFCSGKNTETHHSSPPSSSLAHQQHPRRPQYSSGAHRNSNGRSRTHCRCYRPENREITMSVAQYPARIYQNAPPGVPIVKVIAHSNATGYLSDFRLENNDDARHFDIGVDGVIKTRDAMTYDVGRTFQFFVSLFDRKSCEKFDCPYDLADFKHVKIIVSMRNRYSPIFTNSSYSFPVYRYGIGEVIGRVSAFDSDVEPYNRQIYYFADGEQVALRYLEVDRKGNITLMRKIPETTDMLDLKVSAVDSGSPQKSGKVDVIIDVIMVKQPDKFCLSATNTSITMCWKNPMPQRTFKGYTVKVRGAVSRTDSIPLNSSHAEACYSLTGTQIGQRYMFSVTVNSTNFWYGEDMVIAFDNKGSDSTSAGGVDQGVDYPCRCKDGWSADYCTPEDLCLSDPCGRHASCLQVSPERIQCQCHTEYFGDRCQHFRTCLKAPCLNQGSCHMLDDGNYTCTCRPNFSGQNCEFQKPDPCTPNPCVNGQGRCVLISETAKQCECQPGYYGENCQHTDVCMTSFPCLHGGKCVLTEESYECECPSGRMGKNCGINDPCVISICQNGGSCIATETGDYRCDCLPGYHGSECQYSRAVSCLGMNCNNGTCVTDDQTMMKCDCNKGYSGEFCTSYDVCLSTDTPCSGRGQCQSKTRDGNPDVKDEYTCECNQGFYGKDCQKTDFCYPKVCKNGGKCVEIGFNQYDCQCPNGDYSELCQTPDNPCYEHKCLHDATCQANGTAYMCFCQEDWLGELCQDENPCSPSNNPCSGNSNCTVIKLPTETGGVLRNLTADCICPFGKLGKFCQLLHPCRNSPCLHGTCTVTPLAKTANLTEDAYGVGDLFTCQCSQGYTGDICDVKSCDGIRCLNKGDCYKGSCLCPVDFTGPRCETRVAECDDDSVFLDPKCFCDDGTKVCKPNNCELDQIELSTKDMAMICINSTNVNASFDTVFRCCNGTSCEPYSPTCETRTHCTQFGQQDEDCQYFFYKCQKASQEYCAAFEQEDMSCLDLKRKGDREWIKCAESKLKDMENRVKDPSRLDASQVSEIASYVVGNIDAALDKKEIAQSALNVITGLSDVNASVSQEVEQADGTNSKLRGFLDDYTSKVDINNGSVAMKTKGISVQATNVASFQNDEIIFPSKAGNTGVMNGASITLPNNILKLSKFNVSKDSRLQFVGYQKSQLFIPKDDNDSLVPVPEDVMNKQRVISATVSGVHVYNLTEPIKIELPIIQKGNVHNCVFWDDNTSNWSEEGIETFYDSTSGLITCKSYHLTSFAVLMSPTPDALKGQIGLTYITYIGSGISMACLVLTILTYGLFRCLYGEKSGKILLHLCTSLLLLNVVFLLGSVDVSQFSEDVCTAIAILLHYFVLSTLWWMLVEAIEMYRAIVTVFMKYERFYLIKRCLVGWGIPAVIVAATASVKIDYYGLNTVDEDGNDETQICFMTPGGDNIAYYTSLLAPACLIVLVNTIVFILVVRVILKPRFQQQISNNTAPFTPAQVRGAFTVMFLLGVTWIFGPLAIGEAQLVFSYLFCISNCLQGCLIFVFRCLFNPEAKLAWIQFYRTGTFKRRRGPIKSGYMDSSSKDANDNSSNTRRLSNTQNVNLTTSTNYTSGNNSSMKLPLFRGTSGGIHAHPHQLHTTNGWHPNLNGMKRDNGYNNVNGNGDSNNCSGNSSVVSAGSAGSGGSDRRSRGSSRAESDLMDIHSVSNQSSKYDSSFEKADTKPCEFVADSKKDTPTPGGPAGLYKDEFTHL